MQEVDGKACQRGTSCEDIDKSQKSERKVGNKQAGKKMKSADNSVTDTVYRTGDLVYIRDDPRQDSSVEQEVCWQGPYQVIVQFPNGAVCIETEKGSSIIRRARVKPSVTREEGLSVYKRVMQTAEAQTEVCSAEYM